MPWARWKRTEKHFGLRWGGERREEKRGRDVDILYPWSVECKDRQSVAQYIEDGLAKAEDDAEDGELAIVVLHEKGKRHDNDYVIMRVEQWERLMGVRDEVEARLEELKSDG